ncbi:hypothetical protein FisN_12Hh237 [Fistulifera solaris]|uniref:Pyridoxamine 5'-phosphate oxidase Alr4036 family FMN-binding domain-containing protein n=1 Tax=Fistulifera solaris TaxID=1519565 RepID=A0A1Z5KBJ4_FISSO|nr:hypothetical protein FisN_12Hh237 [Fistulifera solaris]|eukprot:GAX23663.1 hypothetical protein FisN_12Hh237 [Fistulifera solaris]
MSSNNSNEAFGVGQIDIGQQEDDDIDNNWDHAPRKSWRELLEISNNRSRKIRGSNYVQIATVDPETKTPRCRCVVFRGFQDMPTDHPFASFSGPSSCILRMCTDNRSQKVQQAVQEPTAEVVWWFPKTSEQYRIRGELLFVGGEGKFQYDHDEHLIIARKQLWGNMSDAARESFLEDAVPGQAYRPAQQAVPIGGRDQDGKVVPPPNHFLLMLLKPSYVDYLRLTNQYRQVDVYDNGHWSSERVNP